MMDLASKQHQGMVKKNDEGNKILGAVFHNHKIWSPVHSILLYIKTKTNKQNPKHLKDQ